ncbi:astakine-like [Limulus polyphemus]|uniref:Astakine-like n=1 Tax=Limulus polyphemus TaxID=6850 RepID=A0ABM1TDN2_LIMPO|nr:astakine-like [Limulus polyphemus]
MIMRPEITLFILFTIIMLAIGVPYFYGCKSPADCEPGECCVIGMNRYSFPRCEKFGQKNDFCLPSNTPQNKTLYYPNGAVDFSNIYMLFCPCDTGFICYQAHCESA